ncbi:hypothetical protein FNV43_RR27092 [Rhamnella rubrinervis]|uniref:Uncharacterized protein n=1 Tax=Rhamnella rubrinervis TaxID=2594499 RepID=A0A8K0DW76_9ROSA|nr:hypothetical protein FNV43_RR27092 [Rhamnella rubrinervis]
MDGIKERAKKGNLIIKTWERCKSIGRGSRKSSSPTGKTPAPTIMKSRSWPSIGTTTEVKEKREKKGRVAPEGCFSVYVGPQKQRFVVKTEYANHPLFKMLLEEAESEFGYHSQGPLVLPCNVDIFYKVLMEMDVDADGAADKIHQGCGFVKRHGSYHLLSPSPMVANNQF